MTSGWNPLRAISGPEITFETILLVCMWLIHCSSIGHQPSFSKKKIVETNIINYNSVTWLLWHLIHQELGQIVFSCPYSWVPLHLVVQVRLNWTSLAPETHRILCASFPRRFERETIFEPQPISTELCKGKGFSSHDLLTCTVQLRTLKRVSVDVRLRILAIKKNVDPPHNVAPNCIHGFPFIHQFFLDCTE